MLLCFFSFVFAVDLLFALLFLSCKLVGAFGIGCYQYYFLQANSIEKKQNREKKHIYEMYIIDKWTSMVSIYHDRTSINQI